LQFKGTNELLIQAIFKIKAEPARGSAFYRLYEIIGISLKSIIGNAQ